MDKLFDLNGKVALVIGGHGGIGKAVALGLADAGADVAVASRNIDALKSTAKEIEAKGRKSLAVTVDIVDEKQVTGMVDKVVNKFSRIDILVNAAGLAIRKPAHTFPIDEWQKVMDINTRGTFLCCQAVGKAMIARRSGSIINLSSQVGLTPGAGGGAYPISKAGIIMLTRQLALELASFHVRVNALAPGIVKTDFNSAFWQDPKVEKQTSGMVPLGRLAEPEDIAETALFLASERSGYVTGEVLCVNGGWTPSK